MAEWRPLAVKELVVGKEYLVFDGADYWVAKYRGGWNWYDEGAACEIVRVTHWMPLPDPPGEVS